jgi:hypothetical protein
MLQRRDAERIGGLDLFQILLFPVCSLWLWVAALRDHVKAVIARKRCGSYADPEDDGCERLSGFPNADNIGAGPLHLH